MSSGQRRSLLFVSGTGTGGSARSTHALAAGLAARGSCVAVLERGEATARLDRAHKRLTNLREHLVGSPLETPVDALVRRLGARPVLRPGRPYPVWQAPFVEHALPTVLRAVRADVVVASSISRLGWRSVHAQTRRAGLPDLLYIREHSALGHLRASNGLPDALLANARSLADEASALGHPCRFVPSLVDTRATAVESSRRVLLLVNSREEHGVEVALAVARRRPDVPVVLQESWDLGDAGWSALRSAAAELPNVELRRRVTDNAQLYRDARVLLVPHRMDNRPRVILEAHGNGVPVVCADWPGLVESTGPGGVVVPRDAPAEEWAAAVGRVWDDAGEYARLSAAAAAYAARDEVDPDRVLDRFEELLADVECRRPEEVEA